MDIHDLTIIRAQEIWQQAGAYYVRILAIAKKHHITLREEFDEHDSLTQHVQFKNKKPA